MRVLIADSLDPAAVAALEELGCDVTMQSDLGAADLPGAVAGYTVLVVRSTKVTAETIAAADDLALIVRAGAGVNTIALDDAAQAGVYVANCPGKNADAVAELAIGLITACDRGIANATADLRAGLWKKKHYQKAAGLKHRTLGIIGLGSIGREVATRTRAFGMEVGAWSRSLTPERAEHIGVRYFETPLDLAARSDVVSVHLAAAPETKGLIGADFFAAMKEGAIFVNTARGDVVDQDALLAAIDAKGLRVGLDVYANEPAGGTADFPDAGLAAMVTATPHIGASTAQAAEAIAAETVRVVRTFKETGVPANVVNVNVSSPAPWSLTVRHLNRVGVLAGVLDELRSAEINVEEMQNTIFSGGRAACCSLLLDTCPNEKTLAAIGRVDAVLMARIEEKAPGA